jgi:hypothetical protein
MALERKWEKFKGGPATRNGDEIRITLNRRGMIYLNAKAFQVLGNPEAVAIYYSREDDAIALEPAYPRFVEHFKVIKQMHGYAIHASTFCQHYKIRVPATQRFLRPDLAPGSQALMLKLRETVTVGGMKRKRNVSVAQP